MFRLQSSSHQPPRGGDSLRGLPFATVLTLAGVVLMLGRSGAGLDGLELAAAAEGDLATVSSERPHRELSADEVAQDSERLAPIAAPMVRVGQAVYEAAESAPGGGEQDLLAGVEGQEADGPRRRLESDITLSGLEGLRAEGPFHLGSRHGDWTFFDRQGFVQEVGSYRAGRRDGRWCQYARNGQMTQLAHYVDGAQEGIWRRFSQEGALLEEGHYEASAPHGRWVRRYSDGSIKERGRYEAGLREGPWEFFDDLGRPTLRSGTYRAGIRID